jgi:5-methylcytosine-specific restriction endonuclease McrA
LQERFAGPVQALCNTVGTHVCEYAVVAYRKYDWLEILKYREAGHTLAECRRRFGFNVGAWYKAIERGAIAAPPPTNRGGQCQYDWAEVQRFYDEGHSFRLTRQQFGFSNATWFKARQRGQIRSRPRAKPLEVILATSRSRFSIKRRLLQAGVLENRCSQCGLTHWLDKPLSIQIDHINGIKDDFRLENLRMLCPNCHSQTDTHGGKNARRRRQALQEVETVL